MPVAAPWTTETARQAGIKSGITRARLAAIKKQTSPLNHPPLEIVTPPVEYRTAVDPTISTPIEPDFKLEQLELVREQIARTRIELNSEEGFCPACERAGVEPHHRAQLLKALDALLDRQRILHGEPMPGSRRPAQERNVSRSALAGMPDMP